jgi:hypothetical protein
MLKIIMKVQKLNVYRTRPKEGVDNTYPTGPDTFKQPCLQMIVGARTAGKSYLAALILAQCKRDKTFDVVYMITPSWNSNQSYFGDYVQKENVFEPTADAISTVISRVEADRDEWQKFLAEKKEYDKFRSDMSSNNAISDDQLLLYHDMGWLYDRKKPVWKYDKEEPPKSCVILDDILSSEVILHSSGLTKVATLNRHIAPLEKPHSNRSACGLAVIILTQTYRMQGGLGRALRENVSILTLFKNRQEKQLNAIKEELANVVDLKLFDKAYEFATREKYGNLSVDFTPKCSTKIFRKNLNEVIMFDELKCECRS